MEFDIETAKDVKVPEVVIDILWEGNTDAEIAENSRLYLDGDAQEVWTCAENEAMTFYGAIGPIDSSDVISSFPT